MVPKLSVIVPTRGPQKALEKTLSGILQSAEAQHFEVIVINDGGGAAIRQYLEKLKQEGWQVCRIENPVTLGSYAARNQGIQKANGDWLLFADDDLAIPETWFQMVKPWLSVTDFMATNVKVAGKQDETLGQKFFRIHGFKAKKKWENGGFALSGFLFVRNRVFNTIGGFDEKLYAGGDHVFSLRVSASTFRKTFLEELSPLHRSKTWREQFFALCRNHKGKRDQARYYPEWFAKKSPFRELITSGASMIRSLFCYRQTILYQSGEVNWWQHQVAQLCYFTLYMSALIVVAAFPKKPFNW